MISSKLSIVMAAALLVAATTTARAAEVVVEGAEAPAAEAAPAEGTATVPSLYGGKAPYVSFGGVYGIQNVDGIPGGVGDSGGYDIRGGYAVHEMIAVEMQWQSLLNHSRNAQDPVTLQEEPSLESRMLSFNGRVSPLDGRFQPYALLGMGWFNVQADKTNNDYHKSSFAMRFGLGLAAYITERTGVALEAGYILPLTGTLGGAKSFDLVPITLSVFFKFK